ncbi:MAG: hypothetical protein ACRDPG_02430 [Nocardioidaceae bacterium]
MQTPGGDVAGPDRVTAWSHFHWALNPGNRAAGTKDAPARLVGLLSRGLVG